MTITEARRFEMHLELKKKLGDDVADTLMEHLPPSGWEDVVRVRDLTPLKMQIDNVEKNLSRVNGSLKVLIGSVVTVSVAILVLLVQMSFSISQL